jgi:group I intron endonuclease
MMRCGIYKITNLSNGKMYIGSTKDFALRRRTHFCHLRSGKHHSAKLQSAFNKHGADMFKFSTILVCAERDLIFYEQIIMDAHKPAYNVAPVAGRTSGYRHTEETKSKFHLRRKSEHTEESRRARSEKMKGRPISEEHKAKISLGRKDVVVTEETKEKLRLANIGKKLGPMSEAHKRKIGDANKGRKPSQAAIDASVAARLGKKQSEETKEKRAAKIRGTKWTEERRAKFLETWRLKAERKLATYG